MEWGEMYSIMLVWLLLISLCPVISNIVLNYVELIKISVELYWRDGKREYHLIDQSYFPSAYQNSDLLILSRWNCEGLLYFHFIACLDIIINSVMAYNNSNRTFLCSEPEVTFLFFFYYYFFHSRPFHYFPVVHGAIGAAAKKKKL